MNTIDGGIARQPVEKAQFVVQKRALPKRSSLTGRVLTWLLLSLYFGAGLGYLGLRYYVWPRLDDWRPRLVQQLSALAGNPVSIGRIETGFEGWLPRLALSDIRVTGADGSALLTVPAAIAVLSPRTLVDGQLRFAVLQLDAPALVVEWLPGRRLRVAGIEVSLDGPDGSSGIDALLSQRRILVRDASVDVFDRERDRHLRLAGVDFALGSVGRRHRATLTLGGTGQAWQGLHAAFEVFRPPRTRPSDWRSWNGQFFLGGDGLALAAIESLLPGPLPGPVADVHVDLRAWAGFDRGHLQDGLARLAARDLAWRDPAITGLSSLETELRVKRSGEGYELKMQRFDAHEHGGLRVSALGEQLMLLDAQGAPVSGRVSVRGFDPVAALAFARRLPLEPSVLAQLKALRVDGQVTSLSARWSMAQRFDFEAAVDFEGLSVRHGGGEPSAGLPWFENLSGEARITRDEGELRVHADRAVLGFPGIFAEAALPLDGLRGEATWTIDRSAEQPVVAVRVPQLTFSNADAAGTVSGTYHTGGRGPGVVDIEGRLERADATRVARYLPLTIPAEVRNWVATSVTAGRSDSVKFKARGDLHDFPFVRPAEGEFFVDARLIDATLRYAPDWPAIEHLQGNLLFERNGMQVTTRSGTVFGVTLGSTRAVLRDFAQPLLRIEGSGEGPAQDMIRFVNESPVATRIDDFTRDTAVRGDARLQLRLELPLDDLDQTRVSGTVQFQGNQLTLDSTLPPLSSMTGALEFSERGLALRAVSATFLGGPLKVQGETPEPGRFLLRAEGSISAEGMRSVIDNPITRALSGSTAYRATIDVQRRAASLLIESDLEGMGSALPAPFDKPAAQRWPLRVQTTARPPASADERSPGDSIRVELRDGIRLAIERERDPRTDRLLIRRGSFALNAQPVMQDSGLSVLLDTQRLDLDAWTPLLVRPDMREAQDRAATEFAEGFSLQPNLVSVVASEVRVGGKELNDVVIGASRIGGFWRANISARQVNGYFNWRDAAPGQRIGTLTARFTRLEIPRSRASEVESLLDAAPDELPALDIAAEEFVLAERRLGSLVVKATNSGGRQFPVWTLDELRVVNPHATLSAHGTWAPRRGGTSRATRLEFDLDLNDSGEVLALFGLKDVLRRGAGKLSGGLRWNGSPMALDYPTLDGEMKIRLGRGQFLKTDPGLAKLIGVLSLQSLPRRLTLDFRDVFAEGFSFDEIAGEVEIEHGVARTDKFTMRGVQAQVRIRGSADLEHETQSLEVEVRPEINAALASIAYGAMINPLIGLGSFIAQMAFREPIQAALGYEYLISGTWSDPNVSERRRFPIAPSNPAN